ncbi:MAG: phage tail protein I [Erythrobacter sp.]|uniref:phage tail protein I n=1 Tax=Erythrobacter sp. TaxID=1042 RepID=UPI0025E0EEFE|nr:phage tail protein I [Erythrobacter sp.]MCM0001023.1 phage tail protein I [Erythrobacter sp.]
MNLLPPNSSPLERAFDTLETEALADLPLPVGDVWSPERCPATLLPWLGWGLSIDIWDSDWTEEQKRVAIASAIDDQRRKGTRAALRRALDRIDPLIDVTEWFEDPANLEPYTFRLDLPDRNTSTIEYNETTISTLLRDIAAVKPLRAHVIASYRIRALAQAGLVSAVIWGAIGRIECDTDTATAADPVWSTYLQTQDGEPLQDEAGEFLIAA